MKGCFFLLLTISLLVMLQNMRNLGLRQAKPPAQLIQRGMLQEDAAPSPVTTNSPAHTTASATAGATAGAMTPAKPGGTPGATPGTTAGAAFTVRPVAPITTSKKEKGAAPALSSLGNVSILIVLTNTFIQLFHLS